MCGCVLHEYSKEMLLGGSVNDKCCALNALSSRGVCVCTCIVMSTDRILVVYSVSTVMASELAQQT